jgi:hypothetical protein
MGMLLAADFLLKRTAVYYNYISCGWVLGNAPSAGAVFFPAVRHGGSPKAPKARRAKLFSWWGAGDVKVDRDGFFSYTINKSIYWTAIPPSQAKTAFLPEPA